MEKRTCKNSGLELSVIGTGCWTFGGGDYWGAQDQKDVNDVVKASIDLGINYFDTAEVYNDGRSESSLGAAIRGIPRSDFLIGTKVSPSNCYKQKLIESCEASLKRLGTDHIDVYMIHWPIHPHSIRHFTSDQNIINNPPQLEEALESMRLLKRQGKIRHFGVSNFSRTRLKSLPVEEVTVNQLPYNLLCRAVEIDVLSACVEYGIGVIGYMALFQGILADGFHEFRDIPAWRRRTRHFNCLLTKECRHGEKGAEKETGDALQGIRKVSKETGIPMSDLALKWIVQNQSITCMLAGSRNINQLRKNVNAVLEPLSTDIKKKLDKVTLPVMDALGNHIDYYESAENDRTL